jgi:hypothetical protein
LSQDSGAGLVAAGAFDAAGAFEVGEGVLGHAELYYRGAHRASCHTGVSYRAVLSYSIRLPVRAG